MSVKDILIKPVDASRGNEFIKQNHYSGKVVTNSQLHLGAFYHGGLEGVLQFGPPMVREQMLGLVEGTGWNEMMELNRMAFTEELPENSGSRCLSIAFKLFKKHAPHVKWVVSFADATQCGDGAVYRAANFILTGIKENESIIQMPNGDTINEFVIGAHAEDKRPEFGGKSPSEIVGKNPTVGEFLEVTGAKTLPGYQLRYMYFLDADYRQRLTVPEIPFDRIDELGAGMYRGEKISVEQRKP
jgi:hypothetical protein